MKVSNINRVLMFILLILTCLLPRILLSSQEVSDWFLYRNIAFVQETLSLQKNHILPVSPDERFPDVRHHPAVEMMILTVARICNLPVKTIQFLPIGGIFLAVAYYVLCKKIFHSALLASLFAILVSYEITLSNTNSVFTASWAYPLFLLFIMIYLKVLEKKEIRWLLLLFIVFNATHFFYYTTELWMILFSGLINLMLLIRLLVTRDGQVRLKLTAVALLSFIVVFFSFHEIIYAEFIPRARVGTFWQSSLVFLSRLENFLPGIEVATLEKYQVTTASPPILFWTNFSFFLIILVPIILSILVDIKRVIISKGLEVSNLTSPSNSFSVLKWSISMLGIIDVIVYSFYGVVPTRLVFLIFPCLTVVSLKQLKIKKFLEVAFLSVMLLLALSRCGLSLHYLDSFHLAKYAEIEPSADWFFNTTDLKEQKVLSDADTVGRYIVEGVLHGAFLQPSYYKSYTYEKLVDTRYSSVKDEFLGENYDYMILNKKTANNRVESESWKYYEPLSRHLRQIIDNVNLQRVYDDGVIWIFKTR